MWNVRSTTYNNTVVKFVPAGRDVMRNASVLLQGLLDPTFAYSNYNQVPARPHGTKARHASRVHHRPRWSLVRAGLFLYPRRPPMQHTAEHDARRAPRSWRASRGPRGTASHRDANAARAAVHLAGGDTRGVGVAARMLRRGGADEARRSRRRLMTGC